MIIPFTKRLFHNHAPSLLDLLSYWSEILCFGSTGEPADRAPSPRAPAEAGDAIAVCGSPGLLGQNLSVPALPGRGRLSLPAPIARGQPGHQAVPVVTGTFRAVTPGTELWVETLAYFHTGYQRTIQR